VGRAHPMTKGCAIRGAVVVLMLLAAATAIVLSLRFWAGGAMAAAFVEIDAVVLDRNGQPVHGLRTEDFVLKEDKHAAPVLTALEISSNASGAHEPCALAIVLDDTSVLPQGTEAMQRLARAFLAPAIAADRIAIVRWSDNRGELLFGHINDALHAIRNYTAHGDVRFDEPTIGGSLDLLAHVAGQFGEADGRRNTIIAIGNPDLLDPSETWVRSHSGSRSRWVNAVTRLAQTNTVLYVVDANGTNGYRPDAEDGLAAVSGGKRFSTLNADAVLSEIWRDATNYYVLSYVPLTPRPLHDIDVSVSRRGLQVRARQQRGE
jgi:VWFA-related protein